MSHPIILHIFSKSMAIGTMTGSAVGFILGIFGSAAFGGSLFTVTGGTLGFYVEYLQVSLALEENPSTTIKSNRFLKNSSLALGGPKFFGLICLIGCGFLGCVTGSGPYGIYGSFIGIILALFVTCCLRRVHFIYIQEGDGTMYVFSAGLGAIAGGMSGSMFGADGSIFSIFGYIIAVIILLTRLNRDSGTFEFGTFRKNGFSSIFSDLLFFGTIGFVSGGFSRLVCGIIAFLVSFIWDMAASRVTDCLLVFTYGAGLSVACGFIGSVFF